MAQLIRRLGAALLAITLALLALVAPATDNRVAFQDGRLEVPATAVFVPIRPSEFIPYEQKQGPPYDLLAQVTTNPNVTGDCPPGTQTVTGVTGWIGRCEERSFAVALQNSLIPEEGRGDRTPTFTRATTAYQTDFEGKQNLVLSGEARFQGARRVSNTVNTTSEDFNNAAWVKSGAAAVTGGFSDPFGGNAARSILSNTADLSLYNQATVAGSSIVVASIYARVTSGTLATDISIFNQASSIIGAAQAITLNTSWQRFSVTRTMGVGDSGARLLFGGFGTLPNGKTFQLFGGQIEVVTGQANQNPSEYVSVGVLSAPYQGAGVDGVQYFNTLNGNTVASNIVTQATGAAIVAGQAGVAATAPVDAKGPYGYLSEGARADVLGTTNAIRRDMSDVGWVATNVTKGTTTGIDGTANAAATLTATAGNGTVLYTTVLGAAVRTYSAWVSRITGTGTINMTKDGGATWTPITLTTTPTQFQVTTASAANPVVGFQIVTNTDAIKVDFNTLEAATFANPTPIPVNVSKAADVLRYAASGNMNASAGSSYAEVYSPTNDFSVTSIVLAYQDISGTGSLRIATAHAGTTMSIADGTNIAEAVGLSSVTTGVRKRASTWSGTTMSITGDGAAPASGTFNGNMGSSYIQIGGGGFGQYWFGTIRNVRIYPTALSAARAKAITSDAADWLGSPFWRMAANDDAYRIAVNQ